MRIMIVSNSQKSIHFMKTEVHKAFHKAEIIIFNNLLSAVRYATNYLVDVIFSDDGLQGKVMMNLIRLEQPEVLAVYVSKDTEKRNQQGTRFGDFAIDREYFRKELIQEWVFSNLKEELVSERGV